MNLFVEFDSVMGWSGFPVENLETGDLSEEDLFMVPGLATVVAGRFLAFLESSCINAVVFGRVGGSFGGFWMREGVSASGVLGTA